MISNKKCSETVVGLDIMLGFSTARLCSLKRSFSLCWRFFQPHVGDFQTHVSDFQPHVGDFQPHVLIKKVLIKKECSRVASLRVVDLKSLFPTHCLGFLAVTLIS